MPGRDADVVVTEHPAASHMVGFGFPEQRVRRPLTRPLALEFVGIRDERQHDFVGRTIQRPLAVFHVGSTRPACSSTILTDLNNSSILREVDTIAFRHSEKLMSFKNPLDITRHNRRYPIASRCDVRSLFRDSYDERHV